LEFHNRIKHEQSTVLSMSMSPLITPQKDNQTHYIQQYILYILTNYNVQH